MLKKTSCIAAVLLVVICVTASAQTTYLRICKDNGTQDSFPTSAIRCLTFVETCTGVENTTGSTGQPKAVWLFQNYPNPFGHATTIEYQLPKAGNVAIKVFNLNGQLVRTLVEGVKQAGSYKVVWNGRNEAGSAVSVGSYFYQVNAGNKVLTKKMIHLK